MSAKRNPVTAAKSKPKKVKKTSRVVTGEEVPETPPGQFISEQHYRHMLYSHVTGIEEQVATLNDNFKELVSFMSNVQSQLDAIVTSLSTIESDLKNEWAALEAQNAAAGNPINLSGLESVMSRLTADDAAWKQSAPPSGT